MKKLILLSLSLLMFVGLASAQDKAAARKKLNAMRIAFITERVELTPEQAKEFWPIYNKFSSEHRKLRKENMAPKGDDPDVLIANSLEKEQQILELKKKLYADLKNVISAGQIIKLKKAEKDFRKEIIQAAKERRRQK